LKSSALNLICQWPFVAGGILPLLQLGSRCRWALRYGVTSPRNRLHCYWNDLSAKAMSERFGNLQTFLAPAAKLRPGETLRLPSVLDLAAAPTQWVHGIGAVSEAAVGGHNMDDE
jgi:hypothetical protein